MYPQITVLKMGVLDVPEGVDEEGFWKEFWGKWTPGVEAFCRTRVKWFGGVEGAREWEGAPFVGKVEAKGEVGEKGESEDGKMGHTTN